MTIPEAAQLVLQATSLSNGGEVFLLDMGAPVRILDLARKLIYLNSLTEKTSDNPYGDIEIKIKGLRPGEKLFEEMLISADSKPTAHPLIHKAEEGHIKAEFLWSKLNIMKKFIKKRDTNNSLKTLNQIIPEWNRYTKLISNSEI